MIKLVNGLEFEKELVRVAHEYKNNNPKDNETKVSFILYGYLIINGKRQNISNYNIKPIVHFSYNNVPNITYVNKIKDLKKAIVDELDVVCYYSA